MKTSERIGGLHEKALKRIGAVTLVAAGLVSAAHSELPKRLEKIVLNQDAPDKDTSGKTHTAAKAAEALSPLEAKSGISAEVWNNLKKSSVMIGTNPLLMETNARIREVNGEKFVEYSQHYESEFTPEDKNIYVFDMEAYAKNGAMKVIAQIDMSKRYRSAPEKDFVMAKVKDATEDFLSRPAAGIGGQPTIGSPVAEYGMSDYDNYAPSSYVGKYLGRGHMQEGFNFNVDIIELPTKEYLGHGRSGNQSSQADYNFGVEVAPFLSKESTPEFDSRMQETFKSQGFNIDPNKSYILHSVISDQDYLEGAAYLQNH
jgi:hypothetical protein